MKPLKTSGAQQELDNLMKNALIQFNQNQVGHAWYYLHQWIKKAIEMAANKEPVTIIAELDKYAGGGNPLFFPFWVAQIAVTKKAYDCRALYRKLLEKGCKNTDRGSGIEEIGLRAYKACEQKQYVAFHKHIAAQEIFGRDWFATWIINQALQTLSQGQPISATFATAVEYSMQYSSPANKNIDGGCNLELNTNGNRDAFYLTTSASKRFKEWGGQTPVQFTIDAEVIVFDGTQSVDDLCNAYYEAISRTSGSH